MASIDDLIKAIHSTPIIDNHAHPLLTPAAQPKHDLLAITTEAHGKAMRATPSSLSHIRAVNQLSEILGCEPTWEAVVKATEIEKARVGHSWSKRCMEGIETILVDDGLDGREEVFPYNWHDQLVRSKCKRVVRIEKVAEEIIDGLLKHREIGAREAFTTFKHFFRKAIGDAILDPEVVGFKSVICYRSGLDVSTCPDSEFMSEFVALFSGLKAQGVTKFKRIDREFINWTLVNITAELISEAGGHRKPFQFHTGLGDNDITLTRSSPAHLQSFIRKYPKCPIVLLHASYPWTQEAGYLATVYANVYADIGEVFPFLSKEGQERVIREILELCPTEKILWSTDGHWFPETYLLAIIQVREALEVVLSEYVRKGALSVPQAIRAVEDMLFKTSNTLYNLKLQMKPLPPGSISIKSKTGASDLQSFTTFLEQHPSIRFIRMQYVDYTSMTRLRIVPVARALKILRAGEHLQVNISMATLGIIQNDNLAKGCTATGEYRMKAILPSLRAGPCPAYASVQCEFRELDGAEVEMCPRSLLRRVLENSKSQGLEFLLGFEIEILFMSRSPDGKFTPLPNAKGHAWHTARALQGKGKMEMLTEIYDGLLAAGICLETWHPESADGQYEFVLPPLTPLDSCDMLLQAREIITTIAESYDLRATLFPKPYEYQPGTASHLHISISSPGGDTPEIYEAFYAGWLKHMASIIAFTYSQSASYDRVLDGYWAGGRWITWGTQNKETPLRKISGSHWEFKCFDGLAHVYLAVAAIIAAGTQGVADKEKLLLGDCSPQDPASLSEEEKQALGITQLLPQSIDESMEALMKDELLAKLLGTQVIERYQSVKKAEADLLGKMGAEERREWLIERY